jgi:hypothetical protein
MTRDLLQARSPRPYLAITEGWIFTAEGKRVHANIPVLEFHGDDFLSLLISATKYFHTNYVIHVRMEKFGDY